MTIGTSAFAAYDVSYAARTPYITAAEYSNAPTAMDTSNLISGGSAPAQLTALTETIGRASSWVDQFTCGAWGTLCATQNVETGRVWGSRDGTLRIHPKYWPILSVDAFSYAPLGNQYQSATGFTNTQASVTPSGNVWIEPQEFIVAPYGSLGVGLGAAYGISTQEYTCQYTYTNGWPNTSIAASVAAGSASISVAVATGLYPGTMLTIYDLPNDEPVTVASTYTIGSTTVPLTSALQYPHATTATVTNLPPAIKQATILATTAFIKQRGSGALIVSDMGATTKQQTGFSQNAGSDWSEAEYMLEPFRMQYVGW